MSSVTSHTTRPSPTSRRRSPPKRRPTRPRRSSASLFWICVGWIVLVARPGHLRQPAPAAQPRPRELQQRAERRAGLGPPPRHRRPLPGHPQPADLRGPGLAGRRLRRRADRPASSAASRPCSRPTGGDGSTRPSTPAPTSCSPSPPSSPSSPSCRSGGTRCSRSRSSSGSFAAPLIFRVVRASTLSYATRDFVLAAKALGRQRQAHPGPRDPAQHHADDRLLRPDRGGHHHRAGGLAGLPRALRAAADARAGATCSTRGPAS